MPVPERYSTLMSRYSAFRNRRSLQYRELLRKIRPILDRKHKQDRLRPPNFNIFFALGHAYREVSTHSALLAHFLDPTAGHAQGTRILRRFLELVQGAADRQGKDFRLPQVEERNKGYWRCRKEITLENGRIDVLIQGPKQILVIENKIYAGDQPNQLCKYWRYAQNEARIKQLVPVIVYLTPDGRSPTKQSLGECEDISTKLVCLSYREDIWRLIHESVNEMPSMSIVTETLRQYEALLQRF